MDEYINRNTAHSYLAEGGYWEREDLEVAQYIIGQVPAADVVEVRHGEWIPVTTYDTRERLYRCSRCDRYESAIYDYCHCGAKMDGKGEGE